MANHRLDGEHDPWTASLTGPTTSPRTAQPDAQEGIIMIRFREPALFVTTLLAPAVGLALLFLADLPAGAQAGWNAAAVTLAGLITAALVAREKLAPAILGFAQAIISILTVYGFGLTAEQSTGVMAFLALLVGAYVRTQVYAAVTIEGQVVPTAISD